MLVFFVERHPVTISAKSYQFVFSYFCRRSFSDHFRQIILNSDEWFQRFVLKCFPQDLLF